MKKEILKILRQIFVKEKKEIPLGVEAAGLDMQAEKIARELSDVGYRGPISLDFIKRIQQASKPTYTKVWPKQSADVLDMTGKKIHPGETIIGGKGIGMIADDYADLKEEWFGRIIANTDEAVNTFLKKGINQADERFASLSKDQRKDFLNMVEYRIKHGNEKFMNDFTDAKGVFNKFPEDLAYGGLAGMLGEPTYADGGRIGFKGKKFDPKRRGFLKLAAGLATIPFIGKYFKWAKPLAKTSKTLTSVPIKAGVDGMPVWFKPLVNKVIKEGDDVSKKFATAEREIVHKTKLPDSQTDVIVTQDLNTGNVSVELGMTKHGFADGHLGQPVRLEYKAAEDIMSGPSDEPFKIGKMDPHLKTKTRKEFTTTDPKKITKTKEEFWVEEAEFTGGHPENIKFEESTFEKFGEHGSNFDEVEKFATGKVKKKTAKESIKAQRAHWVPEGDYASGGRVPLGHGGKGTPRNRATSFRDYLQLLSEEWDDMDPDEWVGILRSLGIKGHASGGRVPLASGSKGDWPGMQEHYDKVVGPDIDLKIKKLIENFKYYRERGGKKDLRDYINTWGIGGALKEGGRVPMFKGGAAWKKFIESLFIKSSNEIRQGKGIWQGLTQEQWIKQHDNLTKKLKEWELNNYKKLPPGMKEYFGMNEIQLVNAFKKAEAKVKKQSTADEITKGIADVMQDTSEAGLARSIEVDNLKLEFPGITDDMINNILADTNPQRIAEVKATMKEALKMLEKGKGSDEIINIFKKTPRTKHASGGLAGMLGE